jgi:Kef-type K+ transport system membrane component KefB
LHTSFQSLKANLLLSSAVALTGIAVPVGLSYTLQGLLNATPVQAFAAGAALCSTSLGTTFTVLGSSGLSSSRLGVVLTSAAMMDDVVGLVMVQVISNLGGDSFSWVVIVRPVLVSVAFALVVPVACLFALKPATLHTNRYREAHHNKGLDRLLSRSQTAFVFHTALLIGLVAAATYAGTSNLFAAYIAGAIISWWDSEVPHPVINRTFSQTAATHENTAPTGNSEEPHNDQPDPGSIESSTQGASSISIREGTSNVTEAQPVCAANTSSDDQDTSGPAIYHRYYHPAVSKILQPLFFASIGFSIPITRMFRGAIVWRGIVYTILMALGKFVCGLWLVRFSSAPGKANIGRLLARLKLPSVPHLWARSRNPPKTTQPSPDSQRETASTPNHQTRSSPNPQKPFSLHPPLILALAMCARGEIGFLISGVAESKGIFSSPDDTSTDSSDIFLVVTWAIVLCTIMGPLGVGLSVRRVRKLQERKNKEQEGSGRDVLGVWGVE